MTKESKKEKEKQEAYSKITNAFPDFPPYTMVKFMYPFLAFQYEEFQDKQALYKLQHQSWLAGFYEQFFGTPNV